MSEKFSVAPPRMLSPCGDSGVAHTDSYAGLAAVGAASPLTPRWPLVSFRHVKLFGGKRIIHWRRAIACVSLLCVFFLLLHFHVSVTPQLDKECSCVTGNGSQAVATAEVAIGMPMPWLRGIEDFSQSVVIVAIARSISVRAPPVFAAF